MLRGDGRGAFEDVTVRAHLLDIYNLDYSAFDLEDPGIIAKLQALRIGFHQNGKALAHGDLNGDGYVDLIGTNSSGRIWVGGSTDEQARVRGPIFVWLNVEGGITGSPCAWPAAWHRRHRQQRRWHRGTGLCEDRSGKRLGVAHPGAGGSRRL